MRTARDRVLLKALVLAVIGLPVALGVTSVLKAAQSARQESPASSLRQHLAAKRAAIDALQEQAAVPTAIHATVTAESRSGVRRLRIGEFQFLSDSDRSYGGYDFGAGSWDSLIGTLASSVADEYVVQAALKGIALDSLDVVFTSRPDDPAAAKDRKVRYPRNLGYVAYIESPATDAQLEDLRRTVEKTSAAIDLVIRPQPIDHTKVTYARSAATRDSTLPPGLRDYLIEEKRPAVLARQALAARSGSQADATVLSAHTRVEPLTGIRHTRTGALRFQQLHDSAPGLIRYGIAPTVEEHLIGVTGTCLTHIFEVQAANRNVLLDSLELTVDATLTPRFGKGITAAPRFKDIRYQVRIESPASEAQIDGLRQAVEDSCPLYNLLKDEQPVDGKVVRGTYKGS